MIRSVLAAAALLFPAAAAAAPAPEADCAIAAPARPEAPRIEEDEIPAAAPSGAPILDYCGIGAGGAIFADGTVRARSAGRGRLARAARVLERLLEIARGVLERLGARIA